MTHGIVYREPGAYSSFPHVVRMKSGRLALVFRRAGPMSAQAALDGLTTHHDPDSSIQITFSDDDGATWTEPRTAYRSSFGVNDPALTVLRDGTLLLRFVALEIVTTRKASNIRGRQIFSHRVEHGLVATVIGNMVCRSSDEGQTWREVCVSDPDGIEGGCGRDPIIVMPDDSLLMPLYTGSPRRSEIAWVIRSFDDGYTWHQPTVIMCDPRGSQSQQQGINFSETSLHHFGNGHLLALTRADETFYTDAGDFVPVGGLGELRTAQSMDGGLSWTLPRQTGIYGTPGSLVALNDGRLMATYGYRRHPYGVRCCFSVDHGRSWNVGTEVIVRNDAPSWDCGYPFSLELAPGRILTVYYLSDDKGVRHVASSHWELP